MKTGARDQIELITALRAGGKDARKKERRGKERERQTSIPRKDGEIDEKEQKRERGGGKGTARVI